MERCTEFFLTGATNIWLILFLLSWNITHGFLYPKCATKKQNGGVVGKAINQLFPNFKNYKAHALHIGKIPRVKPRLYQLKALKWKMLGVNPWVASGSQK